MEYVHKPVFLLTDFGYQDAYVGVMKAVMLGIAPELQIVDLCHSIEPQNVISAAYVLRTAVPYLPAGSVVVAVVDPGVGTQRRIVALEGERYVLLAPDNGIATLVLQCDRWVRAVEIAWQRVASTPPSATFHGRDVFAPAAALLASGKLCLEQLGKQVELSALVQLALEPQVRSDGIEAIVLHRDRFGNIVTNVEAARWGIAPFRGWQCRVQDVTLPIVRTYQDVPSGAPVAYVGSSGYIEIGVNCGSAVERFGAEPSILLIPPSKASTSPE
ncbi:MAG: SAM-dependent chlorinase/fluorinase [Bacteroidota bacterium]|nr:SAM-dependent chlorinase/fluorinase [Bacteroidota bacterium]